MAGGRRGCSPHRGFRRRSGRPRDIRTACAFAFTAFTGVGKDVVWLALIGGLLVVVGAMLLFDAPASCLQELAYLDPRHPRPGNGHLDASAKSAVPGTSALHFFDGVPKLDTTSRTGSGSTPPGPTAVRDAARISVDARARSLVTDEIMSLATRFEARRSRPVKTNTAPSDETLAPYRGLAPGWYRDTADLSIARFWDGTTLSESTRPVATSSVPGSTAASHLDSYRGLPPGWYRDDNDPAQARYWDGENLGDERKAVHRPRRRSFLHRPRIGPGGA